MKGSKQRKKKERRDIDLSELIEQDDQFYFIAGYTEGGAPYGITWEEHEQGQQQAAGVITMKDEVQMREIKLTEQQLQELIENYDIQVDGVEFFLNIDTGEVVTITSFDTDEEEEGFNEIYFRVPCRESDEGYEDMVDFAETVSDERLNMKLNHVLSGGRRIFRRFKDTLASDNRELKRYYQFVENRNRERIMEWLELINVKATVIK